MSHIVQDWEPVVIRKKAQTAAAKRDEKTVNEARRSGAAIETIKKHTAGSNKAASGPSLNARKLEEDTDTLAHEHVSRELKTAIMKARLDKKMTQAQLAQQINEKPQVIQEYENGKAIPNQQVIGKLERALGVKLRGKK